MKSNRKDMANVLCIKKLAICMLFVLCLVIGGCGGAGNSKKTEVHVGYFPNVTHPQALVMKADGSFQEALSDKATVTWTSFNAGPSEVEALFSGDIDIGYIGPVPAINANVKSKGDISIIAGATQAGAILVKRQDTEISSVADLDGKKVAVPQFGNTQHLCLLNLLAENGLKPQADGGTVDVVAVANADVANMMDQGNIDAALVPEPWGATLLEKGAELVLDENEIYLNGNYSVAVVVVREEFQKEHPEIVKAFLEQHEKATVYINENPKEAQTMINDEIYGATQKKLEDSILEEAFTRIKVDDAINKESIDGFAQISLEQGFVSEMPSDNIINEVR